MGGYNSIFMDPSIALRGTGEAQPMDEQFRPQVPDQASYGFTPRPGTVNSGAVPPAGSTGYQLANAPQIDPATYQPGPATLAYRQMLQNAPTYDQYAPSIGRRLLGAGAGLLTGTIDRMHGRPELAEQEQNQIQQGIKAAPYQRAMQLYEGPLEKAASLAQGEQAAQAVQRGIPTAQALIQQRTSNAQMNQQRAGMYANRSTEYYPHSFEEKQALYQAEHPIRPPTPVMHLDAHGQTVLTMGPDGKPVVTPYGNTPGVIPPAPPRPVFDPRETQSMRDSAAEARQTRAIKASADRQDKSIAARAKTAKTAKPATPAAQAQAEELANRHIASTNPELAKYVSVDQKTHKMGVKPPEAGMMSKYFGNGSVDPKEQANYEKFLQLRNAERDKILGGGTAAKKNYSLIMPGAAPAASSGGASASAMGGRPADEEEDDQEDRYEIQQEEEDEQ